MALLFKFFLALTIVGSCYASECCDGYYDSADGTWNDPQWCSDYCCGTSSVALTCCNNILRQAPADDRSDYCVLWWSHHVWAPILISIFWLGVFIACCVCCYKCCCATRDRTVVVQHQPAMMPGVNIQQISTSQQSSAMNYGYGQMKY